MRVHWQQWKLENTRLQLNPPRLELAVYRFLHKMFVSIEMMAQNMTSRPFKCNPLTLTAYLYTQIIIILLLLLLGQLIQSLRILFHTNLISEVIELQHMNGVCWPLAGRLVVQHVQLQLFIFCNLNVCTAYRRCYWIQKCT